MRWTVCLGTLLLAAACAAPSPAPSDDLIWVANEYQDDPYEFRAFDRRATGYGGFEFLAGIRSLPNESWGIVRHQGTLGLQLMVPIADGPLAVELGGFYSQDDDPGGSGPNTRDGRIYEGSLGLRLSFGGRDSSLVPYIGCGVTSLYARLRDSTINELRDDTATGYYVHGGLILYVKGNDYVALDWRGVEEADLSLFNDNDRADYHQVTLVFGTSW